LKPISQNKNDTIFLQQFIVRQPTSLGFYILDTLGSYRNKYHYNQIKSIIITGRRFNFSASGQFAGRGLLITLAALWYILQTGKIQSSLMIGCSIGTAGYFMSRASEMYGYRKKIQIDLY